MGEEALLEKKKMTEICENLNTVVRPFERLDSPSSGWENCGEPTAVGQQEIADSTQLSKVTTDEFKPKPQREPLKTDNSYPSSLRSTSTCTTYSLEISVSTNNEIKNESAPLSSRSPPESRDGHSKGSNPPGPLVSLPGLEKTNASTTNAQRLVGAESLPKRNQLKLNQCVDKLDSLQIETATSLGTESHLNNTCLSRLRDNGKLEAQPLSPCQPTQNVNAHDIYSKEEPVSQEMEDKFYSFVIIHAEEDTEEAVRIRTSLESISKTTGATFSEDFEQPGCSIFRCVEDAIENSAYTMLLLTPNFNTRLSQTNTESVLMNSLEKPHKYNTVIPLIPKTNGLTRDDFPLVLRTKTPLDETKGEGFFERKVRKVLDLKNIQRQKLTWNREQQLKKQREKQQCLQEEARYLRKTIQVSQKVQELEKQRKQLQQQQEKQGFPSPYPPQPSFFSSFPRQTQPIGPRHPQWPGLMPHSNYSENTWQLPPANIHIQNASYIMIGNNSTMTVGVDSGDEDCL